MKITIESDKSIKSLNIIFDDEKIDEIKFPNGNVQGNNFVQPDKIAKIIKKDNNFILPETDRVSLVDPTFSEATF